MLVKNRKTGVTLKATPRLVARALRESHFELIEDDDFLDLQEVRAILNASQQADEPGIEEILKNLEQVVKEKLAMRKAPKSAEKPKKAEKPKTEKDENPAGSPDNSPERDEFSEIEAKVQALVGEEKDKDHKDTLETMARETFGVELDKRKNLSTLKTEVLGLVAEHRGTE